jgi:hypothetical protein
LTFWYWRGPGIWSGARLVKQSRRTRVPCGSAGDSVFSPLARGTGPGAAAKAPAASGELERIPKSGNRFSDKMRDNTKN